MRDYRSLPVKLTEEEIRKAADREAYLELHERELLAEKKEKAAEFKTAIDSVRAERLRCANLVNDKTEVRRVECEWADNFGDKTRTLKRLDTGEEVETKTMSPLDLQASLFNDKELANAEAVYTEDAPLLTASIAEVTNDDGETLAVESEAAKPKRKRRTKAEMAAANGGGN